MIAPNGPMKFCDGRFGDETWLNQIPDGTSFGVYEISARKSSVPVMRRRSARTSFQAVFLIVRATSAHSNATESPFNFIPRKARGDALSLGTISGSTCVRIAEQKRLTSNAKRLMKKSGSLHEVAVTSNLGLWS